VGYLARDGGSIGGRNHSENVVGILDVGVTGGAGVKIRGVNYESYYEIRGVNYESLIMKD